MDIDKLKEKIKIDIRKLREAGVDEQEIFELFQPTIELSRIEINERYNIRFVDYDNGLELHLSPIHKAVYILFLNHPEGIKFKHLPDYKNELAQIYLRLKKGTQVKRKVEQTIEDITNPLNPSISQKCSRINGKIIELLGTHRAMPYLIKGEKGEERRIALPTKLTIKKRPPNE